MHYLIDFGATLGSASLFQNRIYEGHEYILDGDEFAKSFLTLGIYRHPYEGKKLYMTPATGYFESELFDAASWKPNFPNPAFQNATDRDNYWGAKIVMSFTDEIIDQLVNEARYSRAEDAAHMAQVLRERRDKVGRHWFSRVNPADRCRIRLDGGSEVLEFDDLAVIGNLVEAASTRYRYRLRQDQETGRWQELAAQAVPLGPQPANPAGQSPARVTVEIQSRRGSNGWSSTTGVELLRGESTQIVGIAR
jgi:hypothetical protein